MSAADRTAKLNKLMRIARKHYQPVKPRSDRTILDHLLFACCLEDSDFEDAEEAFARLQQEYFDWNEVRVTTVSELSDVLSCLSRPEQAAVRLKKSLHAVFETHYSFDIESLRKEPLGKATAKLEKYKGTSPFVVAYVMQSVLGGHAIPVDAATINLLLTTGIITEKEAAKQSVPGLERAIPKNKGIEFFSVVHSLAVAYFKSPFNGQVREMLLQIDPAAKDRFPRRGGRRKESESADNQPAAADNVDNGKSAKASARSASRSRKSAPTTEEVAGSASRASRDRSAKKSQAGKPKAETKRLAKKKPR